MCGASLNARYRVTDNELRNRLGLECLTVVMRRGWLRWFSNVERMDDGNLVKGIRSLNVAGAVKRGTLRSTYME